MYLVTLTLYKSRGIYADPYTILKWVAEREEDANQFMEKIANLLDLKSPVANRAWYKDILTDAETMSYDELILDMEAVDTVYSHDDLEDILQDYIVKPEYL